MKSLGRIPKKGAAPQRSSTTADDRGEAPQRTPSNRSLFESLAADLSNFDKVTQSGPLLGGPTPPAIAVTSDNLHDSRDDRSKLKLADSRQIQSPSLEADSKQNDDGEVVIVKIIPTDMPGDSAQSCAHPSRSDPEEVEIPTASPADIHVTLPGKPSELYVDTSKLDKEQILNECVRRVIHPK